MEIIEPSLQENKELLLTRGLNIINEVLNSMLSIYDLYDLAEVFKIIRAFPEYRLNSKVLEQIIGVLHKKPDGYEFNSFRLAISALADIDKNIYSFSFVKNYYVYLPSFLKNQSVLRLLEVACNNLLKTCQEGTREQIVDLADCLHNLPIDIAENGFKVPKEFWKTCVKQYRKKWDANFLKNNTRGRF